MRELVRSSGSQFDPRVISALYGWHEPHASHRIGGRPAHTLTSLVTGSRWTVQAIAVGTMSALGIGLVGLALVSGRPLVPGPPGATTADAARPTDGATGAGGADSGGASSTASKPVSSGAIGAGGQPGATSAGGAGTNPSTVPSPSGPAGTGPVVSIPGSASAVEGVSVTLQGSFSDPAGRAWTGYVTYGDSSPPEPVIVSGNRFSVTHTYAEEGGYELQVWITNESATFGSAATRVAVSDYRPVVNLASATMVGGGPIGTVMNASGSFIDPSRDTWTATVDYGDGTGPTSLALVDHNFSLNHMYAHPGVYTVTVVIRDDEGISGEGRLSVTASP